ncbi:MAG: exodeoxyribonuclease V subunit alpha [Guyparkeria sp.]|uniref:exodeoxyribonuclease V subunit alpha n=1 Tax=Guyparkeria sp. TaxID=2035736 RepID=UPI00397A3F5E
MTRHPAVDDINALRALLDQWVEAGWLRPIDRAVADFLARRVPDSDPLALLAAVLASHQSGSGHVCLDLAAVQANPDFTLRMPPAESTGRSPADIATPAAVLAGITLADWQRSLADHPAVARLDWDGDDLPRHGRPLVLVEAARPQLYLRRYWQVEGRVAAGLAGRGPIVPVPAERVRAVLDALYPRQAHGTTAPTDWQKIACALAARQSFSIITGGPGTGKTTTVVRLLAMLTSLTLDDPAQALPRIALCAPTGKAAARLSESIGEKVRGIAAIRARGFADDHWPTVAAHLPEQVQTIHRLIGTRPLAERPRHHRDNPLDHDIVVVDEASMVGMELMAQLVDALPAHCRLVMLGDKDQLASVEAGAVLGELCRHAQTRDYPAPLRAYLETASGETLARGDRDGPGQTDEPTGEPSPSDPVADHIATLRVSHRFGDDSAIGALARAVNRGDVAAVNQVTGVPGKAGASEAGEVRWVIDRPEGGQAHDVADPLAELVVAGLRPWLSRIAAQTGGFDPASDEAAVTELFRQHAAFQLLCALRRGPAGVEGLNRRVEDWLSREGLLPPGQRPGRSTGWYPGRPVIVTRNDPQLGLANGDIGLTLPTWLENDDIGLRVAFPVDTGADDPSGHDIGGRPGSRLRWVSPTRLPEVETAFALTVHKAQGSEFTEVTLVMPEYRNPILTRELLYTAITRAKRRFTLVSPIRHGGASDEPASERAAAVLSAAVSSVTRRSGNLWRRLAMRLDHRDDDRESGADADEPLG